MVGGAWGGVLVMGGAWALEQTTRKGAGGGLSGLFQRLQCGKWVAEAPGARRGAGRAGACWAWSQVGHARRVVGRPRIQGPRRRPPGGTRGRAAGSYPASPCRCSERPRTPGPRVSRSPVRARAGCRECAPICAGRACRALTCGCGPRGPRARPAAGAARRQLPARLPSSLVTSPQSGPPLAGRPRSAEARGARSRGLHRSRR